MKDLIAGILKMQFKGQAHKLLPYLLSVFLFSGCNDNQPAEKIGGNNSAVASAANSASSAAVNDLNLTVKDKEYGDSGVVVTLDARMNGAGNATNTPTIAWQQTAGPAAVIINPEQLNANVVLPFVQIPTTLTFTVTATANGKSVTGTQQVTALPLIARAQVTNPVLTVNDQFVTVALTEPVAANTIFQVSVTGGTAQEGVDFAPLPATISATDGSTINLPITLLANNRIQDVYSKIALKSPSGEVITITVVAPAETAVGSVTSSSLAVEPPPASSSSVGGFMPPSSITVSSSEAAVSSIGDFNPPSSISTSSSAVAESSSSSVISSSQALSSSSEVASSSEEASSSSAALSTSSDAGSSSEDVVSSSSVTSSEPASSSSLSNAIWEAGNIIDGVIYAQIPSDLRGTVTEVRAQLSGEPIAVQAAAGELGIETIGFAVADFTDGVNQLDINYISSEFGEIEQSQFVFKETDAQTGTQTVGIIEFADSVISYLPGNNVIEPYNDPARVLGQPNYGDETPTLALGDEGVLVIGFSQPIILAGNNLKDIWVFEVGGQVEPVKLEVSADAETWFTVGATSGGTTGFNVDELEGAPTAIQYVRLTDLLPVQSGSPYAGADIDAVGLIRSLGDWVDVVASSSVSVSSETIPSELPSSSSAALSSSEASLSSSSASSSEIIAQSSSSLVAESSVASSSLETVSSSSTPAVVIPLDMTANFIGLDAETSDVKIELAFAVMAQIDAITLFINEVVQPINLATLLTGNTAEINIPITELLAGENIIQFMVEDLSGQIQSLSLAILVGDEGDNQLTGNIGGALFLGGSGDDALFSADGMNVYDYRLGDGDDTIFDKTGEGIVYLHTHSNNVTVEKYTHEEGDSLRLVITEEVGNRSIILVGQTDSESQYLGVADIRFDNGVIWQADELIFLTAVCEGSVKTLAGTSGNDELIGKDYDETINSSGGDDVLVGNGGCDALNGGNGDDFLDGGAGNDNLSGGGGNDTFLLAIGGGQDVINQNGNVDSDVDRLKFGAGITRNDIELVKNGSDLIVRIIESGDSVSIYQWFSPTTAVFQLDQFIFDDEEVTASQLLTEMPVLSLGAEGKNQDGYSGWDRFVGSTGSDEFDGKDGTDELFGDAGNDILNGGDGNDFLDGGAGNDSLSGGGGNDTFLLAIGGGQDVINQNGSVGSDVDSLKFGAGITPNDIELVKNGSDLIVKIIEDGASVSIYQWFATTTAVFQLDQFIFDDGKSLSVEDFLSSYPIYEVSTGAWSYIITNPLDFVGQALPDYSSPSIDTFEWLRGAMPFGSEAFNQLAANGGFPGAAATNWPINTDLWLHKDITVKAGQYLEMELFIDNNLSLWVNEKQYFNDASTNSATDYLFKITIPSDELIAGKNRIMIKAHDFGGYSYAGVNIKVVSPAINQIIGSAPAWAIPIDAYAAYGFDNNAKDWTENGHDGQVFGVVAAENYLNVSASAYAFQKRDSEIYLTNTAQFAPNEFTMSAWVFLDAMTENGQIIGQYDSALNKGWFLAIDAVTQQLTFNYSNQNQLNTIASELLVQQGQWQFVSVIYTGPEIELLINGEEAVRAELLGSLEYSPQAIIVGNGFDGGINTPLKGTIDDLVIWERALTSEELIEFYQLQMPQAIVGDPFWGSVVSLLQFNTAADEDMNVIDENQNLWNLASGALLLPDAGVHNSGALNTLTGQLVTPSSANLWFYANTSTLEMFINIANVNNPKSAINLIEDWDSNQRLRYRLYLLNGDLTYEFYSVGPTKQTLSGIFKNTKQWTHIAVTRSETELVSLFVDGRKIAELQLPTGDTGYSASEDFIRLGGGDGVLFDELRITNGVARYSLDFMPLERQYAVGAKNSTAAGL